MHILCIIRNCTCIYIYIYIYGKVYSSSRNINSSEWNAGDCTSPLCISLLLPELEPPKMLPLFFSKPPLEYSLLTQWQGLQFSNSQGFLTDHWIRGPNQNQMEDLHMGIQCLAILVLSNMLYQNHPKWPGKPWVPNTDQRPSVGLSNKMKDALG